MTTEAMPKPDTGVYRRTGSMCWHWRIKAPKDLRHLYRTEWAHRCSLGTSDLREANRLAAGLRREWLDRFEAQRRELNAQVADRITPDMAHLLAERVSHRLLANDERLRTDAKALQSLFAPVVRAARQPLSALLIGGGPVPLPPEWTANLDPWRGLPAELAETFADFNAQADGAAAVDNARRNLSAVAGLAQAEAKKLGFTFDHNTPGAADALKQCLAAYREARAAIVQRDLGEVIETPPAPTKESVKATQPMRLRDVFIRWRASKATLSADSVNACERAVMLFEEHTENPPVQEVTRNMGDAFRATLLALGGLSAKTKHDRFTAVKSLLRYACRELGIIPRQPWEGLDIEYDTKRRTVWNQEQIGALFGLPLFTRYELPERRWNAGADAAYWIPLLGLFSGARIGELCQLRVVDIRRDEENGFPLMEITSEAEGSRVKSAAGHRDLPIHSELVRLGFLDYVEDMKKAGAESLWPKLPRRGGKPGGLFSNWFNEDLRQRPPIPVPDFHSLRHTVRMRMLRAGVDVNVRDWVTGHAVKGSVGTKSYEHADPELVRDAIERIRYPGLNLPRVYRPRTFAATSDDAEPTGKDNPAVFGQKI